METERSYLNPEKKTSERSSTAQAPQISLPKGGGAIRSIDDKFMVNAANGSAGCSFPFPFSPSRNGSMPELSLSYNSGSGNSIFGLGWTGEPAAIVRKTEKQLPQYNDESDIFIFSGAEDLVPSDDQGDAPSVKRYRPRIETGFSRIEKIHEPSGNIYWTVTTGSNVVSVFGKSPSAQLVDPNDPARIFKWLLEFSYDDKGNCLRYEYKQEDKINVPADLHEKNRLNNLSRCTNIYLKRIKYCNKVHFDRSTIDWQNWDGFLSRIGYLLELVLDYGDHDLTNPHPTEDLGWPCRTDPFSNYRAGFEIRTWRLCYRVLMFHHFAELGTLPCLVRSMDMEYGAGMAFTFLQSVTYKGYIRRNDGSYSVKAMPPVEFTYEALGWNTGLQSLPAASAGNLPIGIDDHTYQWIDLYNEGISGILTEQAGSWYYKGNLGNGHFDDTTLITSRPSLQGVSTGALHFQDIEATGQKSLVSKELDGYYELSDDNEWLAFTNFKQLPRIDLQDIKLRLLDLNGDGMADILILDDEAFTWYASKGKLGYGPYQRVHKVPDEEKGPSLVFSDNTQSILLADMCGHGLMDIVRVRNSEVVYWPNLGYGKFGAKVTMSNAPVLDTPESFNPRYVKLADLDGSGTTDLIYLGKDSFRIYFNQAGNRWSETNLVNGVNNLPFPKTDEYSSVTIIDLLGNGTGCIVWSSPLPQYSGNPLYYIDLMGGKKPYVLTGYKNNMGKEVIIQYKPSTFFYLADKKAGTPWVTRLPFPVQCVCQTILIDQIRRSRYTNQYTYHHGYYDHTEREFRGFGRVDQTDTEDFVTYKKQADKNGRIQLVDEALHQPPVLTKTWYHTGAFFDNEKIFSQFAHEYYQNNEIPERELADPPLPAGLTIDEWREALRACKGIPLRVEVYSPDGSEQADHPYTTTQHSCLVQILQPRLNNVNAVFTVNPSESLTYTYERDPANPRISQNLTIEVDEFGNVLKSAAICYGRRTVDPALTTAEQAEQGMSHITFSVSSVTNKIDNGSDYHLPLGFEARTYELTGLSPDTGNYFSIDQVKNDFEQATLIPYQALPAAGIKEKRLIDQAKSLFLKNDMSGPLAPGLIESLALPYQTYKLALTPDLRASVFGDKVTEDLLMNEGKYVHLADNNYWVPSGTQTLDAVNFYQVTEMNDPFGSAIEIQYDEAYRFFVQKTSDALKNETVVSGFNFRILSPWLMKNMNDNLTGVRTDELGVVTSSFLMGKENEKKGDLLDADATEISPNDQPSSLFEYNLFNYFNNGKPNYIKTTAREAHYFDSLENGLPVILRYGYAYFDGSGKAIMQKAQAEPGIALRENPDGTVTEVDTSPGLRWIGNGRTIVNNKGMPVKQYDPYFSTTFDFEDASELVERGVTPIIYYDPVGRAIRTDFPDGTFTKIEIDSWMQRTMDRNDTVLDSQWYKDRITAPVPSIATPEEVDAANKAAAHANTPTIAVFDPLGRAFISVADNGPAGKYKTITRTDIEGNVRDITNAAGNIVIQYRYDMLAGQLYQNSMDAGERWGIKDVMSKSMRTWDSRTHRFRYEYDSLHRPLRTFMQEASATEITIEKIVYGEVLPDAKTNNLRGEPSQHFDASGVITMVKNDFKGNPVQGTRQLLKNYKGNVDWNNLTEGDLEAALLTTTGTFDAMNRPLITVAPDGSIIRPVYNAAGSMNEVYISIKGAAEMQFVKDIEYDAKGQRQSITYANNTKTNYQYDPRTFRLQRLTTMAQGQTTALQDLQYTYDPVGNISFIKDNAQPDVFFDGKQVKAENDYVYDAVYRLIEASGREHIGQNIVNETAANSNFRNFPFENGINAGDIQALRNYTQKYSYDVAGNIGQLQHLAGAGSYTRTYQYNLENDQLLGTAIGNSNIQYQYDVHGNMLNQPHLQNMVWNFKDELSQIGLGGGGTAYYVYDSGGQRVRKVIERPDGTREERIYLGGLEFYRKTTSAGTILEETETLHIMDDASRIALAETKTIGDGLQVAAANRKTLTRYQYSNHLGSASLELDENAVIISYEEYHPYGTTSFASTNKDINAAAKRYRYTGMERDEESGLAYHSARYYLPWLARWLSADPVSIAGGLNLYSYVLNNPLRSSDTKGTSPDQNTPAPKTDAEEDQSDPAGAIEVHPYDPASLEGQAALGFSQLKSRTEMNKDDERLYNQTPGHWTMAQRIKWYADHPGAEAQYWANQEAKYQAYIGPLRAALKKQESIMNAGGGVGKALGWVTVGFIAGEAIFADAIIGGTVIQGAKHFAVTAVKGAIGGKVASALTSSGGSDGGFGTVADLIGSFVGGGWKGTAGKTAEEDVAEHYVKSVGTGGGKPVAQTPRNPSTPDRPGIKITEEQNLAGNANGETHFTIGPSKGPLSTPQITPTEIKLRSNPGGSTYWDARAHEYTHWDDMVNHPQFSWMALASKAPGRGVAALAFEMRGYAAEFGWKVTTPFRAWLSMNTRARVSLVLETAAAAIAAYALYRTYR